MMIVSTEQELEDWVTLIDLSGITTLNFDSNGAIHVVIDSTLKRKALATMALLSRRLKPMPKPARHIFLSSITLLGQQRERRVAEERQAYRVDLFVAMDHEDETPWSSLHALAPSLH